MNEGAVDADSGDPSGIDAERLAVWLRRTVDPSVSTVDVARLAGGNSSGAWKLDLATATGTRSLVLKAPGDEGIVFERDASREGRILDAAATAGAPVPAIAAIDPDGEVLGRPCFVMELVEGRAIPDATPASIHGDGWFRDAPDHEQAATWFAFVDALAALHATDASALEVARRGPGGVVDELGYWRRSLLDASPAALVPRQLAVLDWLADNIPAGADADAALCMGDARLGNAIMGGTGVQALVDFEVAYLGHPAADIGYCLVHEAFARLLSDRPATGIPTEDETWDRWGAATGRPTEGRDYWTAFGATVLCITGTRAMLQWGMPVETVDHDNLVVAEWERLIGRAAAA